MQQFTFTSEEIDNHAASYKDWHNFVRRREAEMTFSLFPDQRFQNALELGAGDGGQSATISQYCDRLTCTEKDEKSYEWLGKSILERKAQNTEYLLCDAQDLSRFPDAQFDLVFSSNMLEHIPDVEKCLKECGRVLSDDGQMLHLMPSRWWKVFNLGLGIMNRNPEWLHGVSRTILREFYSFGSGVWKRRIESNGLIVKHIVGMPFYVGHGNSFISIIKAGNWLRLPASYLYVIRRSD
ncbi:MAG: class I SAM-dependent methyltransferase [Planctomycetaceae bacterium]